jgi:hypothetical protein
MDFAVLSQLSTRGPVPLKWSGLFSDRTDCATTSVGISTKISVDFDNGKRATAPFSQLASPPEEFFQTPSEDHASSAALFQISSVSACIVASLKTKSPSKSSPRADVPIFFVGAIGVQSTTHPGPIQFFSMPCNNVPKNDLF